MKKARSFIACFDEYRKLLEELVASSPGPDSKALAMQISAMFEEDVKYPSRQIEALDDDEKEALDCIREYWAKERIDLRRGHSDWVKRGHGLLDYISYYDHHHRPK